MIKEDEKEIVTCAEGLIIAHPLVHSIQVDSKVVLHNFADHSGSVV